MLKICTLGSAPPARTKVEENMCCKKGPHGREAILLGLCKNISIGQEVPLLSTMIDACVRKYM